MAAFNKETFTTQVKIGSQPLTVDMADQPSLYAHYAVLSVEAQDLEATRKLEREVLEANLDKEIRVRLGDASTEKAIQAQMKRDPRWQKSEKAYLEAKYQSNMTNVAVEAFMMRARMLSSMGAIMREEMNQQFLGSTPVDRTGSNMDAQATKLADRVRRKLHDAQ